MAGIKNNVLFGGGYQIQPSSAADIIDMQNPLATDVSNINHTGNPEGVVSANPSSLSHDPVSGVLYLKLTGTGNTGWTSIINPSAPLTITGNSGLPLVPTLGNWNIFGSGSLTSAGLTSTLTFSLTGLTNHNVLVGAGTDTITKVAPPATAGIPLVGNGVAADPSFSTALVPGGGTGITSYNQGDLLYASATSTLATLAKNVTATRYLANTGTSNNPNWDQVNLANGVIGTLPVGNGGTGATTLTGVIIGNGASPMTGNPVTQFDVLVGGAGNAISSIGPGTSGQLFQSGGNASNPAYTTSTYPATNAINTILYASSANAMAALPTANNGVLITSAAGVPSLLAAGTTGQVLTATTGAPATWQSPATSGTVTSVSVVSANGLAGTVATATTTPAITLTTTATGVLSGNGTAISGSPVTNHNVLVAGASNAVTSVAPTATTGIPLVSNGASVDPSFSTASVSGGGTGLTSTTPYAVLTGGTTSTSALQQVAALGASGTVLTSNGAGALPSFQTPAAGSGVNKIINQVFTASGTYTPSAGMLYCVVEVVGGGGGGGGVTASGGTGVSAGGGGSGGYARKTITAATIGVSQVVTIGAAGAAGTAGNNAGGNGGTSSLGALITAAGGIGGLIGATNAVGQGGTGGAGASGDFNTVGQPGGCGFASGVSAGFSGFGGSTFFGGGGKAVISNSAGIAATSYGGGGSGAAMFASATATAGGAGFAGIITIREYTT